MKKSLILFIVLMMPMFLFGQSYKSLWNQVEEAEDKDLPKTAYEVLQKIVKKATKEKAYGQLLKAELQSAQVMAMVAPDSLKPAMDRMVQDYDKTKDMVLKTVWQTVLYKVAQENSGLMLNVERPKLTEELCLALSRIKDEAYAPMVIRGADAGIFNNDLLHVIGYELNDYRTLHQFYDKAGNRRAACITASEVYDYAKVEEIDSVIKVYEDLPEAGELAIARYYRIRYNNDVPMGEKLAYLQMAQKKWASWKRIQVLSNIEADMTNPQYKVSFEQRMTQPMLSQDVKLDQLRNLSSLTMKVYRVNANGDIDANPNGSEGYKKVRPLLGEVVLQQEHVYEGKEPYEFFKDTLTLEGLPVGVYMVEFQTKPSTEIIRSLYHVTDVYVIAEPQPVEEGIRYVVVSATTGQPIAHAKLHIKERIAYNKFNETNATTNEKGEFIYKARNADNHRTVFAYTDADKACMPLEGSKSYSYYGDQKYDDRTCIYTDRAIYRPGQTVHASVILYSVMDGFKHKVRAEEPVKLTLRDANYKVVAEKEVVTDAYGTCAADFTLPATGLTGRFTLQADRQSYSFRVEEYKRPTFHVDFAEVTQAYEAGDTLTVKGTALSFAGVPVQGAKVKYKVMRRTAFWWWSYSRYWDTASLNYRNQGEEICSGEILSGDDGTFDVAMPLKMPETNYPMFYHFVVTADVTDTAGETRSGELSVPLGNRKQVLSVDLAEKILKEDQPTVTFHLLNAAGKDLDAEVNYRIESLPLTEDANPKWLTAKTNTAINLPQLPSGAYRLLASLNPAQELEEDFVKRDFVIFSEDDVVPATETNDWFWQSATQFTNDGKPVTVQVGSSAPDVHMVYSIFAGKKVIEQGAFEKSNQLVNLKLTYEEAYGNGLLLTFAWVKNGRGYTHSTTIKRPLPDKRLTMEWKTFRNRLTPGQQEEWILTMKDCNGKPVDAQLMATLYDQSLDQIYKHAWSLVPYVSVSLPSTSWSFLPRYSMSDSGYKPWRSQPVDDLVFSHFDENAIPEYWGGRFRRFSRGAMVEDGMVLYEVAMPAPGRMMEKTNMAAEATDVEEAATDEAVVEEQTQTEQVQVRENLNETAFFYPQLVTAEDGSVALKFTLPECLTTWHFMGIAHSKDMHYGYLSDEAVAQKDVMIQPNMPRFLRDGDEGSISARIFNTSEKTLKGKATLKFIDPETNAVVLEQKQDVSLAPNSTTPVTFEVNSEQRIVNSSLLICQVSVNGVGFSDGEQHYLPILPSTERVTVAVPITQHHQGEAKVDLAALIPTDASHGKFTLEYTNHPAWLMIQALPTVGNPVDDNAISQAASYYANSIGHYILQQNPQARMAFQLWKQEANNSQLSTLNSQLEKNQELKDLVLSETPWMLDADRETEQKQRLGDFFDENLMQNRLNSAVAKLKKLQLGDGSWSWWKGMEGSFYMTVAVSEMLVRLNAMTGAQDNTKYMLSNAFEFMGSEIVKEVEEMKKWERKGEKVSFPSFKALEWLYLATLDGRELPAKVQEANNYLLKLLKKDIKRQSIYEKALSAVILSQSDPKRALEYAQSLKEYTVFREEMGRYYDTPRAGYSWYDYKIPTQTVAIEALQRLTPDDQQTIEEMQRWLLQEKRTQAWDTPINSVNAVYAFLGGETSNSLKLFADNAEIKVDGKQLELPKATAAIGYVKTSVPAESKELSINKTTEGTSWGAVYAQFTQPVSTIADSGSGLTIKRELFVKRDGNLSPLTSHLSPLMVGDRIRVRITITADRDYDFVQVVEKRAACMEPVRQLSGWHQGSYCTPHDCATNYYFDCLSKGKHVIENEYFIDREGTYETGTCTVECAYAPEFRAITHSQTLNIK